MGKGCELTLVLSLQGFPEQAVGLRAEAGREDVVPTPPLTCVIVVQGHLDELKPSAILIRQAWVLGGWDGPHLALLCEVCKMSKLGMRTW